MSMANYLALSRSSIKQACDLVKAGTLELHANLCKYLGEALIETDEFLRQRSSELSELRDFRDKRRVALRQLYAVIKQAETLVLKCCKGQCSAWPKRALALLGIKEDILDIVLHLRWWESILEIAIASTGSVLFSQMSELECLKSANQKFETTLETLTSSSNELQQVADLDNELLVQKIDQLCESYAGEPGIREHYDYLISIQVRSLLTDEEVRWTSELNDYKYLRALGKGGYGVVLHVKWCSNDCALKNFDTVRHHRNEAKSLNKCRHPHIVQCFRYWEQSQQSDANTSVQSHILMELMPTDLAKHMSFMKYRNVPLSRKSEVLKENPEQTPILPFSNPVAVDVMLQLSKAMWHVHSKGNIHRDLKPGNVLMRRVSENEVPELFHEGFLHVKLADFGLVRGDMMSSNDDTLTQNAGSTLYRAPELSLGQYVTGHNYPRKADVWSFGIMSAEILSGLRPFPNNVLMIELKASIKSGLRPHLPDDCPDYLKAFLEGCWKYEPTERPRFSEIWKMLRFAKLRSLGIIEQNYDLFIFEAYRDHVVELVEPPQLKPPVSLPQAPGLQPQLPLPKPQPPLSQRQPQMPLRPFVKKKCGFFTSILVKLGLVRRTKFRDPSAHLESPFDKPLNFLGNQVWPPENSTEKITCDTPGIDVIFFEGNVGGRPMLSCRDTWLQRKEPYAWWPRDWLPNDVEGNVRVLVLEYIISDYKSLEAFVDNLKPNLIFSEAWNQNHTWQRPMVLVGHSLGCTVIETLVTYLDQYVQQFDPNSASECNLRKAETSKAFLKSLAGCFFYAPPCKGLVPSPKLLSYVFGGLTYSDELFTNLPGGSLEPFVRFAHRRNIKLMALIEGRQTQGRFVVTENSIQGLGIEYLRLEDSNHSEVCKPVDRKHPSYTKLVQFIAACAEDRGAFNDQA